MRSLRAWLQWWLVFFGSIMFLLAMGGAEFVDVIPAVAVALWSAPLAFVLTLIEARQRNASA